MVPNLMNVAGVILKQILQFNDEETLHIGLLNWLGKAYTVICGDEIVVVCLCERPCLKNCSVWMS